MNTKTTISLTEARKKIYKIADEVQKPSTFYTLTEKGRPKVVVMSAEEFETIQETLEVMKEFPDIKEDTQKAELDYKEKKYISLESIIKSNNPQNFMHQQKHVPSSLKKKSRKRAKATS